MDSLDLIHGNKKGAGLVSYFQTFPGRNSIPVGIGENDRNEMVKNLARCKLYKLFEEQGGITIFLNILF